MAFDRENETIPSLASARRRMSDSFAGLLSSANSMFTESAANGSLNNGEEPQYGRVQRFDGDANSSVRPVFFTTMQPNNSPLLSSPTKGGESLGGISRIKSLLVQMQYQRKSFCEEAFVQYQVLEQQLCQVTQCKSMYDSSFEEAQRTLDVLKKDREVIVRELKQCDSKIDSVEEVTNRIMSDHEQYVREEREWKNNMETQLVELRNQATSHLPDVLRDNSLNRSITTSPLSNAAQASKTVDFKNPLATIAEYNTENNRVSGGSMVDDADELLQRLESSYVDASVDCMQHPRQAAASEPGRKARRLTKVFCSDCQKWKALLQSYFRSEEMSAQKISQLEKEKQTLEDVILSSKKVAPLNNGLNSGEIACNSATQVESDDVFDRSFIGGTKRQLFKDYSSDSNSAVFSPVIVTTQQIAPTHVPPVADDESNARAGNSDESIRSRKRRSTASLSPVASSRKKYQKTTVETNTVSVPLISVCTQYEEPFADEKEEVAVHDRAAERSVPDAVPHLEVRTWSTAIPSTLVEKSTLDVGVQADGDPVPSLKAYSDAGNETLLPTDTELKLREMLSESDEQIAELVQVAKSYKEAVTKLEADVSRLNTDLLQRDTEIARVKAVCAQLDNEQSTIVDRFADKLGHTRQLENHVKQLSTQLSESEMQLRSVRRQLDDANAKAVKLQQQYDAERTGAADVQRLKRDADRALELARSKETYSAKAQQQLENQCKEYVTELTKLREKFQILEVENNAARARIESLSTKCSYYETLVQERSGEHDKMQKQLLEELAEQTAEGEQQLRELSRQHHDRSTLQAKLAEFMDQMDVSQRQLSTTRNELSMTSKLLASQKLDCYRLERDADVFKLKLAHAEERAEQLESTLAAVRAEHEREVGSLRTQKDNLAATNQDLMRQLALEKQKGVMDKLKESLIGGPSSSSGSGSKYAAQEISRGPRGGGASVSPHSQQKHVASSSSLPRRAVPPTSKQHAAKSDRSVAPSSATKPDDSVNNSRAVAVRRSASNREASVWISPEHGEDVSVSHGKHGAHHHNSASQYDLPNAVRSFEHESVISTVAEIGDAKSNMNFNTAAATGTSYLKNKMNEPDLASVASSSMVPYSGNSAVAEFSEIGLSVPRSILKKAKTEHTTISGSKHCIALDAISLDSDSTFIIPELDAESLSQVPALSTRRRLGAGGSCQTSGSVTTTDGDNCSLSSYSSTADGIISEFEK